MPLPVRQDIPTHYRNDTFEGVEFILYDKIDGNPVRTDLGASDIKIQFKKNEKSSNVVLEMTSDVGGGLTITDSDNGIFEIDEQIISIKDGVYVFDVQVTTGEVVRTYIRGKWSINRDITDA